MSLFEKMFGKKEEPAKPAPPPAPATPPAASPPPPGAPAMMKVWDNYGRVTEIPREEWRTKVLPHNFQQNWNDPDKLAGLIHNALSDGFFAECLGPAWQLQAIDTQPRRAAVYLGVTLLQLKRFDEAEKVITDGLKKIGEDGVLTTNLAKAQAGRGENALAEKTLWHALELDPNQDNAIAWYTTIHKDRGGDDARWESMRRIAALPGSWRAQLWLARAALQARQLDQAVALYEEALSRAGNPVPTELLQQMSGDLGNAAHLPELLRLAEPRFVANVHGLTVGNNLIKAHLDLGQFEAARKILDQLYALNRGDWKQHLSYWDTALAKARIAASQAGQNTPLKFAVLTGEGPIWLKPDSPAAELFPVRAGEGVSIAFFGSSAEIASNSQRMERQMSDGPGRLSRALPLYLAEQVEFNSNSRVRTLVPWIASDPPGFVFSGVEWKDDEAANHARQGDRKSDYVVIAHLKANAEPWSARLRLVRTIDAKCLGTVSASWPLAKPELGLPDLARQLLALLAEHAEVAGGPPPPAYEVPAPPYFGNYLLRLEQLLAVRCAGMGGVKTNFLNGEREIIDGNLQLCLEHPQNIGTRILLAQTLAAMKRVRPDILPEFKDKIALLQMEKQLSEPAQSVVQRMLTEVFAT